MDEVALKKLQLKESKEEEAVEGIQGKK